MRWLLTALASATVACTSPPAPSAPPAPPPSAPAATTPVPASARETGGVSREEAEQRDVLHAGYAVGVAGPLRAETKAGQPARVVYTVTNTGDTDDTYTVSATRGRTELAVRPERVTVKAGGQALVEVLVPGSAGGTDVRVVVRSTSDAGVRDEATTIVVTR